MVDYQPQWVRLFDQERELLCDKLGKTIIAVHHVGSTAVVGLAAKPIIDIILEVTSVDELDEQVDAMTALGYTAKGENGIARRRFFYKGGAERSHHIHAFNSNDEHIVRHVAFRDYLCNNPDIAREYAQIKKDAALQCNHDALLYGQLKNEFISHHELLALELK